MVVLALEGEPFAGWRRPHAENDLELFLEHLEPLTQRREGHTMGVVLRVEPARAQPQLDASVTHRVNLGHGDRKDARQAKGHGCDERAQPYAGGLAGDAG